MSIIAHSKSAATLYDSVENGWTIQIKTTATGKTSHAGRAQCGTLLRFDCSLTLTVAEKRLTVVMFEDCLVDRMVDLIRLSHTLARRNGDWPGTDWGRGLQRNGHEWQSIKLGLPIDVESAFNQLIEHIDLTSDVTA